MHSFSKARLSRHSASQSKCDHVTQVSPTATSSQPTRSAALLIITMHYISKAQLSCHAGSQSQSDHVPQVVLTATSTPPTRSAKPDAPALPGRAPGPAHQPRQT
eukprot:scaffold192928_cov18-Tisochrysis_lutea.AAC.1